MKARRKVFKPRLSIRKFLGEEATYCIGGRFGLRQLRKELDQTHERTYRNIVGLGPRVGYRFNLGKRLYIGPWVSVGYQFNAKDVTISGKMFHEDWYSLFPAAHLGWKF